VDVLLAHRNESAAHHEAGHNLACQCAGSHPACRFAGRRASAAAIVADAVFHVVGAVGVPGPTALRAPAVILGALIDLVDEHGDRCAGRDQRLAVLVRHHAGENANFVRFAPLGHEPRLAGAPAVEFGLDLAQLEADAGRTTIDHSANGWAVAFAPGS